MKTTTVYVSDPMQQTSQRHLLLMSDLFSSIFPLIVWRNGLIVIIIISHIFLYTIKGVTVYSLVCGVQVVTNMDEQIERWTERLNRFVSLGAALLMWREKVLSERKRVLLVLPSMRCFEPSMQDTREGNEMWSDCGI